MEELYPIKNQYDWEIESHLLREKRHRKQFPPISGELPAVKRVFPMCFNKDGYLIRDDRYDPDHVGGFGAICLFDKPLEAEMDLCLRWCIYRSGEPYTGDPVTVIYEDVLHCPKGTEAISGRRELVVNYGWGLDSEYVILADVVPANREQENDYYRAHPEKKFPYPYSEKAEAFSKGSFEMQSHCFKSIMIKHITAESITPYGADDTPLDEFSAEKLSTIFVKLAFPSSNWIMPFTCSYARLTDPDGECVQQSMAWKPVFSDGCTVGLNRFPTKNNLYDRNDFVWRKGTYTYEISLLGSNTVTGQFTVT